MIRIRWRSKITGFEGHGQWCLAKRKSELLAWIERLNPDPWTDHWIEVLQQEDEA